MPIGYDPFFFADMVIGIKKNRAFLFKARKVIYNPRLKIYEAKLIKEKQFILILFGI